MKTRKEEVKAAVTKGFIVTHPTVTTTMSHEKADLTMAAIVDAIMAMPCEKELDIEKELAKLYGECKDDGLKVDLLMSIHSMRIACAGMKKEAAK